MNGILSGKTIKDFTASIGNVCAIASDDKAYCWGNNNYGEAGSKLDMTSSRNVTSPVAVDTSTFLLNKTISKIFSGGTSQEICVLTLDNIASCWGGGSAGQLGNSSHQNSNIPTLVSVPANKQVVNMTTGGNHLMFLTLDNLLYSAGYNYSGQIGVGNTNTFYTSPAITLFSN